jgi:hypothetical protein
MRSLRSSCGAFGIVLASTIIASASGDTSGSSRDGTSRALIIVGLAGDDEHAELFRATAGRWREWLVESLRFPEAEVRILAGAQTEAGFSDAPATAESIVKEAESLRLSTKSSDRVWIFVLGHANFDDGHALFHLPGPDLPDDRFAALFDDLTAQEQVFWLTTAASGAFVKPFSKTGRIVVAATEKDGEANETEFPHALAEITRKPDAQLDLDKDGQVSIQELFDATVQAVEARFAADQRAPTEHAQLDDNGDGIGTEAKPVQTPARPDGSLSSKTFVTKVASNSP